MPVLMYGRETIWKDNEWSMIRAVQLDNLRGLLGIRRMKRVPNAQIWELCGLTKRIDERIDKGVLRWFSHVKRIENDRIVQRVYVWKCVGSHSTGQR